MDDATYEKARELRKQIRHIEMTYNEMIAELDEMAERYPRVPRTFIGEVISKVSKWVNDETRVLREEYEKI